MRKLFHFFAGLCLIFIISLLWKKRAIIFVLTFLIINLILDIVRFSSVTFNNKFFYYLRSLLREEERRGPTGSLYYLSGILLTIILFPRDIALFAIGVLAAGDPFASMIGERIGKYRIGHKSIEGCIAFVVASVFIGFVFHRFWPGLSGYAIALGAMGGAGAELFSSGINDNITIPVITSLVLFFIYYGF